MPWGELSLLSKRPRQSLDVRLEDVVGSRARPSCFTGSIDADGPVLIHMAFCMFISVSQVSNNSRPADRPLQCLVMRHTPPWQY